MALHGLTAREQGRGRGGVLHRHRDVVELVEVVLTPQLCRRHLPEPLRRSNDQLLTASRFPTPTSPCAMLRFRARPSLRVGHGPDGAPEAGRGLVVPHHSARRAPGVSRDRGDVPDWYAAHRNVRDRSAQTASPLALSPRPSGDQTSTREWSITPARVAWTRRAARSRRATERLSEKAAHAARPPAGRDSNRSLPSVVADTHAPARVSDAPQGNRSAKAPAAPVPPGATARAWRRSAADAT